MFRKIKQFLRKELPINENNRTSELSG